MHDWTAFENRLRKVFKTRKSWAQRLGVEAYRLYDMDIPDIAFVVDVYGEHAVVYDRIWDERRVEGDDDPTPAVARALAVAPERVHVKRRRRMPGAEQYEKLGEAGELMPVKEAGAVYLVNLDDYLDTGLFLDHRPMRQRLATPGAAGKRFLNLFCYTGAVSVAAARGGAVTTSVDMSNTYLAWAEKNFQANGLDPAAHRFVRDDALSFLEDGPRGGDLYDTIFLDPPTFSNSKRMQGTFDVQRDHTRLVDRTLRFLAKGGTLYFSTNKQKFKLDPALSVDLHVRDLTEETIPEDFRDRKIHRCYEIRLR